MGQILRPQKLGVLSKVSSTQINLTPSIINIGGQQFSISSNLVMNLASSGFGGLDTGSVAASTAYHVYAVINGGGAVGLVASLALPAVGPAGFSQNKYLWSIHTDQSSIILNFQKVGKKNVFLDSLSGIITTPDVSPNNAALSIDSSGAPSLWPFGVSASNNLAFTNNMLNGLADEFQGLLLFWSDGGSAEWSLFLQQVSAPNQNISVMSNKMQSGGKPCLVQYTGKVGDDYQFNLGNTASFTTRILQNQILSYDNKLAD